VVFGEPALGLDRRGATHAGGGDGLTVHMIGAIPGDVNARDLGLDLAAGPGDEVAVFVEIERALERRGVGHMADGDEDALERDDRLGAGLRVLDLQAGDITWVTRNAKNTYSCTGGSALELLADGKSVLKVSGERMLLLNADPNLKAK